MYFPISLLLPGKFCIGSQGGKFPQFCKPSPPPQQHQGHKQSNSTEEEGNMLDIVTLNPPKASPWWIPAHYCSTLAALPQLVQTCLGIYLTWQVIKARDLLNFYILQSLGVKYQD